MSILELYPFAELTHEEPITPLIEIEVQSDALNDDSGYSEYRHVSVCHKCFNEINPDMWIDQSIWESLSPVTKFEELPIIKD